MGGFSVGGTKTAIESLKVEAEERGALQAKVLKTSGAFHTPLMKPAQDKLSEALDKALPNMKPPQYRLWMNSTGEALDVGCNPKRIVFCLNKQLTNPVLWMQSVKDMIQRGGIEDFYEVGPQKQLKAMMKRIDETA